MIYVCVPVHNEALTAGLVLWKVRQVFTAFPREYQILVCDDASTDDTAEVLGRYARVLPMTVVTHRERQGYARSLEELLRMALQRTDRPKRDCAVTLHGDFLHPPDAMEEMAKRLESGADLVVGEVYDDELGQNQARALDVVSNDGVFGDFQATLLATGWGDLDQAGIPTYAWGIHSTEFAGRPSIFPSLPLRCADCGRPIVTYAAQQAGASKVASIGYGKRPP